MAIKQQYIRQMLTAVTQLNETKKQLIDFTGPYFPRGYNSGGADPIIDADVAAYGITAADFTSIITLADDVAKFFGNQAVTTGDRNAILNRVRTDI